MVACMCASPFLVDLPGLRTRPSMAGFMPIIARKQGVDFSGFFYCAARIQPYLIEVFTIFCVAHHYFEVREASAWISAQARIERNREAPWTRGCRPNAR